MKTILILILSVILSVATAFAGSVTITTTPAEDALIAPAMGAYLGLPGNATQAEVKQAIIQWITGITQDFQRQQNQKTFIPPTINPQ